MNPEGELLHVASEGLGVVVDAVRQTNEPHNLNPDVPQALIFPQGAALQIPDLSNWRQSPMRRIGCYRPATVEAFTALTTLYADEATTVWVHPTTGEVIAVFDDNAGDEPGWGDHRAVLMLATTPEWVYWMAKNENMMNQEAFAEHIEGGLEEIVTPDAADMLEIAQSFHAAHSANFRSQTRLASGELQFQYDEEVTASAGKTGNLTVPTTILLAIAPFLGEDRYKITARLRFRLAGGKLTLGYLLDRPDAVIRDALNGVAERLAETFPRVFVGSPAR